MKLFRVLRLVPALLSLLLVSKTTAQTVNQVILTKGSEWQQTSAADPVLNPRNPGPGYGGPIDFNIRVSGTNISGITPPVVALPAGSLYPTQNPFRHNGGILTYVSGQGDWNYGVDGNNWGGQTEAERDAAFAFGTYGMTVLGETFSLNFPANAFPVNTPKVTLTGGTWVGGKYLVEANQPLTITTNAFTNFAQNADGVTELDVEGVTGQLVFNSDNPGGPNFLTTTIPANTLVAGTDYSGESTFYGLMDKRGSIATRIDATVYARSTNFTIAAIPPIQPGAQATLYGVGDIDGGNNFSEVRDATKSGGVIYAVGDSSAYGLAPGADTATFWTSTNGLVPLRDIVTNFSGSSFSSTSAIAITPGGDYIASRARATTGGVNRHAVRVTTSNLANLDLGTLPGFNNSQTSTVSNDGSVLYGIANYTSSSSVPVKTRAVRFTSAGPTITVIPFLNVGDDNSAPADRGASADGSVMVGRSTNGTVDASPASFGGNGIGLGNQAFRYVHGAGVSGIPFIGGGSWSGAVAVTPDGNLTLVRGNSTSAPLGEFYLHNATTGTLTSYSTPNGSRRPGGIVGISADGSIVATSFNAVDNPTNATVIRNTHGWHDFQSLVERAGVNLAGWDLRSQTLFGLSPDATLVWGRGIHNGNAEGFVVEFAPGYLASATEPETYSTPGSAIVGAWTVDGSDTTALGSAVFVFFADGYYLAISTVPAGDTGDGANGFERGQYTWNPDTGAFTMRTLLDTNGDFTLSGSSEATDLNAVVSGNAMTVTIPGHGVFALTRVIDANPIVGAWGRANLHNDSSAAVFLSNGYYFMAQDGDSDPVTGDPNGHDGMEWGTYTWDPITGAFSATPLVDTNDQWGFSNPQGAMTITLSSDRRTATFNDNASAASAPRTGIAIVEVALSNLGLTYDGTPRSATVTTTPSGIAVAVTYDGSSTLPVDAGTYAVVVTITDPNYFGTPATGTLVINPAPASIALSNLTQAYDGTPRPATVTTTPSGVTTSVTYNGDSTAPTAVGNYPVVATLADSNYTGVPATGTLAVLLPVQITSQPVNTTVTLNGTASFTVVATGTDVHYQWRKGSVDIPGATTDTLTLSTVQSSDAGNYRVIVSNAVSSLTSNPATLTVITPIVITTQPQSLTIVAGQKANFSVTATGTNPTYQWQKGGVNIAGATARTFSINGTTATDSGTYRVIVTNTAGSVPSDDATLTVNVLPSITTQPVDVKVSVGGTATFTVVATGTGPLTYQWRKGNTPIAGATSATLTLTNVQTAQAGNYAVDVSNVAGSVKSSAAKLTVK